MLLKSSGGLDYYVLPHDSLEPYKMSYRVRNSEVRRSLEPYDREYSDEYIDRDRIVRRRDRSVGYERERESHRPSVLDRLGPVDENYRDKYRHPDIDDKVEERYVERDTYRNPEVEVTMDDRYVERERYSNPEIEERVDDRYAEPLRLVKVVKLDGAFPDGYVDEAYREEPYRDEPYHRRSDEVERLYDRNGKQKVLVEAGRTQRMYVERGGTKMYLERDGNQRVYGDRGGNPPRHDERGGEYLLESNPRRSLSRHDGDYERYDARGEGFSRNDSRSVALTVARNDSRSVALNVARNGTRGVVLSEVRPSPRYDPRNDILHDPRNDVRNDIRDEVRNDALVSSRHDFRDDIRNDTRNDILHHSRHDFRDDFRGDVRKDVRGERYGPRFERVEIEYPIKEKSRRSSHYEEEEHGRLAVRSDALRRSSVHNDTYRRNESPFVGREEEERGRPAIRKDVIRRNSVLSDTYRRKESPFVGNPYVEKPERGGYSNTFRRSEKPFIAKAYVERPNGVDRRSPRPTQERQVWSGDRRAKREQSPMVYSENDPPSKGKYFFGYAELPPQVWEDAQPEDYNGKSGNENNQIMEERGVSGVRRKLRDVELDDRHESAKRARREEAAYYGTGYSSPPDRHTSERKEREWGLPLNRRG